MTAPPSSHPPAWARLLDFLCLLIVIVATVIAASGGFRVRIGGLRIALTSPVRLLIWAAVIGIVRHLAAPSAPIYRDLPARLRTAWRTPAARAASAAFAGTRFAILFVGLLAVFMFGYRDGRPPWRVDTNEVTNLQARWDTGWYLSVAIDGYYYDGSQPPERQQNIVFFPAFPMMMRLLGRLLGGASTAYLLGGTVVSLGAFFWALVYLFRLARDLLGDDEVAASAVWLLATYPFAIFYSAVYSESVYLLAIVGACYHFRRGQYLAAALWGLLAGLDRAPGCFLSVALLTMAFAPRLPTWLAGGPPSTREESARTAAARARLPQAILTAAMPGLGMLLFSAYAWLSTGNPLVWAAGHAAWGREYSGLGVFSERADWLWRGGLYVYAASVPADLLNGLGALFVLASVWPVARRLGLAYGVLVLINILPPIMAGGFLSAGRFSSVLFPSFVWLAGAVPSRHRLVWMTSFVAVQALCAALFYTWRPLI